MNVLMFSTDYWPDTGGIANHVYYLSRAMARQGISVTVVGGHSSELSGNRFDNTPNLHEILIQRKYGYGLRSMYFIVRSMMAVMALSNQDWDVVHYHNFLWDGLIVGLTKFPKSKVRIYTNHSSLMLEMMDKGKSLSKLRLLVKNANGIIGPSQELTQKSSWIATPQQPIIYIPNGVDTSRFTPPPHPLWVGDNKRQNKQKFIVAIRRHDPKCGLIYLIEAARIVTAEYPEVIFCLYGDGEETAKLKQRVKELGLEEKILFPGRVAHQDLPDILRSSYVTVLPSLYEAVSLSGLESMACGVPVIGTKVGGIPEIVIPWETGWLVPPRSSQAIAQAIIESLEQPDLRQRMSENCRRMVVERYSWENIARRTIQFYQRLGA